MKGRKVLVLGLGDTGLSMARWCRRLGALVTVADTRQAPPNLAQLRTEMPEVGFAAGMFEEQTLRGADMIAISPGVDRREPAVAAALRHGTPMVGDIELFARALHRHAANGNGLGRAKVLAITGTNGKSTVTSMAGDICGLAALHPVVAGNIGTPILDALSDVEQRVTPPGAFVLELSSFQLESTVSLNADAAAMLNVTEDHMDRYDSLADYAAAKARVFAGDGVQVLNQDDERSRGMALAGRRQQRFGMQPPSENQEWGIVSHQGRPMLARGKELLLAEEELPVAGKHNAANALAAGALCHAIGVPDDAVIAGLKGFRGLPHRVERIAIHQGVEFYDDSKGTNVGATVAALRGFRHKVVLIAGGDGKGQDFSPLREPVKRHARAVVLIGRDGERIAEALRGCGVTLERAGDMRQAVHRAWRLCRGGEAVVLSPACASFDMFRNYAHRGAVFAAAARELAGDEQH